MGEFGVVSEIVGLHRIPDEGVGPLNEDRDSQCASDSNASAQGKNPRFPLQNPSSTQDDSNFDSISRKVMLKSQSDIPGDTDEMREYMTEHCLRHGRPRYAIKKLKDDIDEEVKLTALVDLASEGKFQSLPSKTNFTFFFPRNSSSIS